MTRSTSLGSVLLTQLQHASKARCEAGVLGHVVRGLAEIVSAGHDARALCVRHEVQHPAACSRPRVSFSTAIEVQLKPVARSAVRRLRERPEVSVLHVTLLSARAGLVLSGDEFRGRIRGDHHQLLIVSGLKVEEFSRASSLAAIAKGPEGRHT